MSDVTVTVLGSAGSHPGNDRAGSSYLVSCDGHHLLLDCGNGSLTNLLAVLDPAELDAVVISHLHPDHFVDLYGLHYALRFHPSGPRSVDVYAPRQAPQLLPSILLGDTAQSFVAHCRIRVATAGQELSLGPFSVRLYAADHPIETLASRIAVAERVVAFSGDSGRTAQLVRCAERADLFICDSTWVSRDGPFPPSLHMTGAEAGQTAAEAAADRLLVTHVFPQNDPVEVAAEAAEVYDGKILIATDREEHQL